MILVEGPDKVGKSTLVHALARKFKAPEIHYGPMPDWWKTIDYVARVSPFAVYSRYHWSALAYQKCGWQPPGTESLQNVLDVDAALRVRCNQRYTSVLLCARDSKWFDDRPADDMFSLEQIKAVNDVFLVLAEYFDRTWFVDETGWPDVGELNIERI